MVSQTDLATIDRRYRDQASWTRDLRLRLFEAAALRDDSRLLDVGAGTGAVAADIARARSHARLTCLDIDFASLVFARRQSVPAGFCAGDAHALPFGSGLFDAALFHFVLLWLKRPVTALREAARVTRPGGFVLALAEPDHEARIDAPSDLEDLGRWQTAALARQGADTRFGRKLRGAFVSAGLTEIRVGVLGGEWARSPTDGPPATEWTILRSDLADRAQPGELDRWETIDRQAWADGTRVLFVPTFFAAGRVPPLE